MNFEKWWKNKHPEIMGTPDVSERDYNLMRDAFETAKAAEREGAMSAILEGCPNDGSDAEIILRRAWERVRVRSNVELTGRAAQADK